jgi:hypothetical protein
MTTNTILALSPSQSSNSNSNSAAAASDEEKNELSSTLSLSSKILCLSFVTLAFCVASVVILHMQLPFAYVVAIDHALGDVRHSSFFLSMNVLFIVSSSLTVIVLVVLNSMSRMKTQNYLDFSSSSSSSTDESCYQRSSS